MAQAWDPEHGGLAYSFDPDGSVCNWDKIFWVRSNAETVPVPSSALLLYASPPQPLPAWTPQVQCESIGTAAMLASATGKEEYWGHYERLWEYSWEHFVDHEHGSWHRRANRQGELCAQS